MRQQLLGWKRVKQWMIAAIAAVQHEISTSQPTFLSFAFQRVFWRFWGVDSSAWKKSYCRMLGLSLQIQILFNPLTLGFSGEFAQDSEATVTRAGFYWGLLDHRWPEKKAAVHTATCFHICVQDTTLFPSIEQRPVLFDQRCVGVGGIDTCHSFKVFPVCLPQKLWKQPHGCHGYHGCLILVASLQQSRMAKRDYHIPVYGSQGCHPSDAQGVPGELPKVSPLVHFYQEVVLNFSTSDWKVKLKQEIW